MKSIFQKLFLLLSALILGVLNVQSSWSDVRAINIHLTNYTDNGDSLFADEPINFSWSSAATGDGIFIAKSYVIFSGNGTTQQPWEVPQSDSLRYANLSALAFWDYDLEGGDIVEHEYGNGSHFPADFDGVIQVRIYTWWASGELNGDNNTSTSVHVYPSRQPPPTHLSGTLTFHFPDDSELLVKNRKIQLFATRFPADQVSVEGFCLDSAITDSVGNYYFPICPTPDYAPLFIRVEYEVWDNERLNIVCDGLDGNSDLFYIDSDTIHLDYSKTNENTTNIVENITIPFPQNSDTERADVAVEYALNAIDHFNSLPYLSNSLLSTQISLGKINLIYGDQTTGWTPGNIYVKAYNHDILKDEVSHEVGHQIAYKVGFCSNSSSNDHAWSEAFENGHQNDAWAEGWADFFACVVKGSSTFIGFDERPSIENPYYMVNIESGEEYHGDNPNNCSVYLKNLNSRGDLWEGTIAGILWDLYDNDTEDSNYNDIDDQPWPDRNNDASPLGVKDGHGDHIREPERLFQILNKESISNLQDIYVAWKIRHPENEEALWSVFWEHGLRDNTIYKTPIVHKSFSIYNGGEQDELNIQISWVSPFLRDSLNFNRIYRRTISPIYSDKILVSGENPIFGNHYYDQIPDGTGSTYEYSITVSPDTTQEYESDSSFCFLSFGGGLSNAGKRFSNTSDYIFQLDSINTVDTMFIYPTTNLYFAETGKIVVPNGHVLKFVACDSLDTLDAKSHVQLFDGATLSTPAIEVLPGGKVIGKHAHFENLPIAIHNQGGIVQLDSCEFVNCAHPIVDTLQTDTLTLTNTKFINDSNGVAVYGTHTTATRPVTIRNCSFHKIANIAISLDSIAGLSDISQCTMDSTTYAVEVTRLLRNVMVDSCNISAANGVYAGISTATTDSLLMRGDTIQSGYISWFHNAATVLADNCVFTSKTAGSGYGVVCDGESGTSQNMKVSNSKISGFLYGAWLLYADATMEADSIWNNSKVGISCDHHNASYSANALITECDIHDNGGKTLGQIGGLYITASNPIVTCNHIYNNRLSGCYISNSGRPKFKDTEHSKVGANLFENDSTRSIFVISAFPDFKNGGNMFVLGQSPYYGCSNSTDTVKLWGNYFEPQATLDKFTPSDTVNWGDAATFSSSGSECGATLINKRGIEQEHNNCFVIDSLIQRFTQKQTTLKELLTYKGSDRKELLFTTTYQLDAEKDFSNADNVREVILQESNSYDSLRVRYDKYLSNWLLRTPKAKRKPFEYENLEIARAMTDSMLAMSQVMSPTQPEAPLPKSFKLYPVYPNPFNSTTRIHFDVPTSSKVKIIVYDALGRRVATLADKNFQAGSYHIEWNGNNASGMKVSSGVYFVSMRSPSFVATKKAVLLK